MSSDFPTTVRETLDNVYVYGYDRVVPSKELNLVHAYQTITQAHTLALIEELEGLIGRATSHQLEVAAGIQVLEGVILSEIDRLRATLKEPNKD